MVVVELKQGRQQLHLCALFYCVDLEDLKCVFGKIRVKSDIHQAGHHLVALHLRQQAMQWHSTPVCRPSRIAEEGRLHFPPGTRQGSQSQVVKKCVWDYLDC